MKASKLFLTFVTLLTVNLAAAEGDPVATNFQGLKIRFVTQDGTPLQNIVIREVFRIEERQRNFCFFRGSAHAIGFAPGWCYKNASKDVPRGDDYPFYEFKNDGDTYYRTDHNGEIKTAGAYLGKLKDNQKPIYSIAIDSTFNQNASTYYKTDCELEAQGSSQINALHGEKTCVVEVMHFQHQAEVASHGRDESRQATASLPSLTVGESATAR